MMFGDDDANIFDKGQMDYVQDYMQEINDYIMNGLYKALFANRRLGGEEATFYRRIESMNDKVDPTDFGIPANQLTDVNISMYTKAVKELQKLEKYPTPSLKLRYLMNSVTLINNTFSLFSSSKEGQVAAADDMLQIFPYIVMRANINRLFQHVK